MRIGFFTVFAFIFLTTNAQAQRFDTIYCTAEGSGAHKKDGQFRKIKGDAQSQRFANQPNAAGRVRKRTCIEALKKCVQKFRNRQEGLRSCRITRHINYVEAPGLGTKHYKDLLSGRLTPNGGDIRVAGRTQGPPKSLRPRPETRKPPRRRINKAVLVCRSSSPQRKAEAVSAEFDPQQHDENRQLRKIGDRVCKRSMVSCMYKHDNVDYGYRRCRVNKVVVHFLRSDQKRRELFISGNTSLADLGVRAP